MQNSTLDKALLKRFLDLRIRIIECFGFDRFRFFHRLRCHFLGHFKLKCREGIGKPFPLHYSECQLFIGE
jgi:hypothetical protein